MTILKNDTQTISRGGRLGSISYPYKYGSKYIYPINGPTERLMSYQVLYRNTYFLSLIDYKESVITGHFVPGDYRVNPYHVAKAYAQLTPNVYPKNRTDGDFIRHEGCWPAVADDWSPIWWIKDSVQKSWSFIYGDWWQVHMYERANLSTVLKTRTSFEQLALQKAYSKVSSSDLDIGEVIGEFRETVNMLRHPLSSLRKFLVDDKQRNLNLLIALRKWDRRGVNRLLGRTGKASADAMSSTWLELRYGLRPLVMLVQDVVERVSEKHRGAYDPDIIRSARSKLVFGPFKTGYSYTHSGYNAGVKCELTVEDTYTATASVQYRQQFDQTFLDSLGLTPRFLPEVAWELTRLSFVWDWFLSIGPWLGTLRYSPGYEILGNTVGFKSSRLIKNGPPRIFAVIGGDEKPMEDAYHEDDYYRRDEYERVVDLSLSYLPHFTWGRTLDLYKAIDSVSLIWQFAAQLKGR